MISANVSRIQVNAAYVLTVYLLIILGARNPSSEHSIQRIFTHPEYNSRTDDNDIALLLTTVSIEWSRRVAPICLPYKSPR